MSRTPHARSITSVATDVAAMKQNRSSSAATVPPTTMSVNMASVIGGLRSPRATMSLGVSAAACEQRRRISQSRRPARPSIARSFAPHPPIHWTVTDKTGPEPALAVLCGAVRAETGLGLGRAEASVPAAADGLGGARDGAAVLCAAGSAHHSPRIHRSSRRALYCHGLLTLSVKSAMRSSTS